MAISIENNIKIYTFKNKNKNKFDQKKIEEFQIFNNDKYIIKNLSFKTQKKITAICDKKIKTKFGNRIIVNMAFNFCMAMLRKQR